MHDWTTVDWDSAPVEIPASDDFRCLAGEARDDQRFYTPEFRRLALAIERYLTRYSRHNSWTARHNG
jgi:hypothetical protein